MTDPIEGLLDRMLRVVPSLAPMLDEHRQFFGDEAPKELLRDLALVAVGRYLTGAPETLALSRGVLDFVEGELGGDETVDRLLVDAFVTHLREADGSGYDIAEVLGPKLRAALEAVRNEGAPAPEVGLVHRLVAVEPALEDELREHLNAFNVLLSHLFFGDVSRRLIEWYQSGGPNDLARLRRVFGFMDAEFGNDNEIDELIGVSLVENMPFPDEPDALIVDHFGPKLREEYESQQQARG